MWPNMSEHFFIFNISGNIQKKINDLRRLKPLGKAERYPSSHRRHRPQSCGASGSPLVMQSACASMPDSPAFDQGCQG